MRAQSKKARTNGVTRQRLKWSLIAMRGTGCEACHLTPEGADPARPFDDMHEKLTRARGGDVLDPDNILLVCRTCHDWITGHELEARALGLVRGRTAEEHHATFHPWEAPIE